MLQRLVCLLVVMMTITAASTAPMMLAATSTGPVSTVPLEKAVDELRSALIHRDDKRLLGMMSKEGVEFIGDIVSIDDIRDDFRQRGTTYCGFFDGECLRANDRSMRIRDGASPREVPLLSIVEHLSSTTVQTKIQDSGSGSGYVRFIRPDLSERPTVEFELKFEHKKWWITALPLW